MMPTKAGLLTTSITLLLATYQSTSAPHMLGFAPAGASICRKMSQLEDAPSDTLQDHWLLDPRSDAVTAVLLLFPVVPVASGTGTLPHATSKNGYCYHHGSQQLPSGSLISMGVMEGRVTWESHFCHSIYCQAIHRQST